MRQLKSFMLITIVVVLAGTACGEVKGWGVGVGAFHGDFGIQVRKDFWLGGDISQITGQAAIYFPRRTTFRIDADYHFIINPDKPSRFYPLAGLDFAFNADGVRFGINGGGGVNFKLTESLAAFGEVKYTFSNWDGFAFTFGVYI